MPFQYQPYSSPFAGSIAQLIARRGEIAAHAAELAGQANARGAEQSGAAWANGVQNTGQILGSLPLQMAAARRAQTQDQLQQIAVTEAQQRHAGGAAVDTMMRGDQLPPGEAGPRQASYLDANGLFDIPKMTAALGQSGMGHLAPDLLKGAESINESILKHQELEQKTAQQQTILIGDLADGALKLSKSGVPLVDAMDFAVQPALATKRIKPEDYQRIRAQIAALSPEQQTAAMTQFMDQAAKMAPTKTLGKDAQESDRYGRVITTNLQAEPNKGDYTGPDGIRYHANGTPVTGQVMRPQGAPKSIESKSVLLNGQPAIVNYDPATGKHSLPDGTDVSDRVKPIPAASITIHNQKEKQEAPERTNNAEQLVLGNMPPSMLSKRSADYNATLAEANRINKERTGKPINIGKLQLDYEAAKKFVSGMNSTQMIRYRGLSESVVNTIDEVQRLADALQQGGVQKWNSVTRNSIRQIYGNTPESELANQYVGAINTLKEEFANLANGGYAPTDSAWKLANDQINGDFGFKDLRASLTEVQRLINYRSQAFSDQKAFTPGSSGATPDLIYDPATKTFKKP